MILSLKNIGKVESAKVELNGITVIAGENDTGKSTIGKALYSIFNGFYKIESKIRDEREDNIERLLDVLYHNVTNRMTMRVDTEGYISPFVSSQHQHLFWVVKEHSHSHQIQNIQLDHPNMDEQS